MPRRSGSRIRARPSRTRRPSRTIALNVPFLDQDGLRHSTPTALNSFAARQLPAPGPTRHSAGHRRQSPPPPPTNASEPPKIIFAGNRGHFYHDSAYTSQNLNNDPGAGSGRGEPRKRSSKGSSGGILNNAAQAWSSTFFV